MLPNHFFQMFFMHYFSMLQASANTQYYYTLSNQHAQKGGYNLRIHSCKPAAIHTTGITYWDCFSHKYAWYAVWRPYDANILQCNGRTESYSTLHGFYIYSFNKLISTVCEYGTVSGQKVHLHSWSSEFRAQSNLHADFPFTGRCFHTSQI
jgi:hypothetical protein